MTIPDDWTKTLETAIAAALVEYVPSLRGESIAQLAVDCHPWNGIICLAILTERELIADELLADPREMAAWTHYDFTCDLQAWRHVRELGSLMQRSYDKGDKAVVAEAFLRACARAVTSSVVVAALTHIDVVRTYRATVTHPDDGREFVGT